jgi:hypothetical protein
VIKKKKPHQTRNTSLGKRRSIGHIPAEDEESSVTEISSETEEPSISFSGCAPLSKLDDTHWFSDLNSGFSLFIFSRGINLFPSFTTRPILTGNGSLSGYRLGELDRPNFYSIPIDIQLIRGSGTSAQV